MTYCTGVGWGSVSRRLRARRDTAGSGLGPESFLHTAYLMKWSNPPLKTRLE
jgi:hypothetical protein